MTTDDDYLSVHIYYNVADLRAILLECVAPLVRRLDAAGTIRSHFVIRYWDGGAHVRLRLLPAAGTSHADLKREVEPAIEAFLRQRPSLFDPDPAVMAPLMRTLFVMEHGEAAYVATYGASGGAPLYPNNSYRYVPYVPEIRRYGGPRGVALSEAHFHTSTRIAFEALCETQGQVRTSTLGLAFQLMLHFACAYFDDRARVADFFRSFATFFRGLDVTPQLTAHFERSFARQAAQIDNQFERLESTHERLRASDPGVLGQYARSAADFRERVAALHRAGGFAFDPPAASLEEVGTRLLTSHLHMMNNRLGVLIVEEIYMAHLIVRALERSTHLALAA